MKTIWLFIFIFIFFTTSVYSQEQAPDSGQVLPEIHGYLFHTLAASDQYMIWVEDPAPGENPSVMGFNFSTGSREQLSSNEFLNNYKGSQVRDHPSISGNFVVWEDNREIHLYNLSNHTEVPVTATFTDERIHDLRWNFYPEIDGDSVVWAEQPLKINQWKRQIILYNITTGVRQKIFPTDYDQSHPDISGNYIVWEDYRNGPNDRILCLFDRSTGNVSVISSEGQPLEPKVDGHTIVWTYFGTGMFRAAMYDIVSSTTRDISPNSFSNQDSPMISGNRVIWLQSQISRVDSNEKSVLQLIDLSNNEIRQLGEPDPDIMDPVIHGDRIVYGRLSKEVNATGRNSQNLYNLLPYSVVLHDSTNIASPAPTSKVPAGNNRKEAVDNSTIVSRQPTQSPGFGWMAGFFALIAIAVVFVRRNMLH